MAIIDVYFSTYFAGSEPYCIFIGGECFVIIREAQDVESTWRETQSLNSDDMIQQMFDGIKVFRSLYLKMCVPDAATLFLGPGNSTPYSYTRIRCKNDP